MSSKYHNSIGVRSGVEVNRILSDEVDAKDHPPFGIGITETELVVTACISKSDVFTPIFVGFPLQSIRYRTKSCSVALA